MMYDKKKLMEKLNHGEDLKDQEYRVLIWNGRYQLLDHLFMIGNGNYRDTILSYAILGSSFVISEGENSDFARACAYMMRSYPINLFHYESALKYVNPCIEHLSRFNTVNFLNQVEETNHYDHLIGNLHESISSIITSKNYDGLEDMNDTLDALEESRNKIKTLKKKYIGFTL